MECHAATYSDHTHTLLAQFAARHAYSYATGLALLYYVWGNCVLHVFIPSALTYAAMALSPKSCGMLSWLICFPYLLYM